MIYHCKLVYFLLFLSDIFFQILFEKTSCAIIYNFWWVHKSIAQLHVRESKSNRSRKFNSFDALKNRFSLKSSRFGPTRPSIHNQLGINLICNESKELKLRDLFDLFSLTWNYLWWIHIKQESELKVLTVCTVIVSFKYR